MKTTLLNALFACTLPLALCTARADIPPAERLLPSDTLAVLCAPDWSKVTVARQQAPFALLWKDPAMRPFCDKFLAKLTNDVVAPIERDLGAKLTDYADLLQGQFTLAVTRNGWTGASEPLPAFLLVLDARDKADLLRKNLADVKRKLTDSGRKTRTDTIRGVEFTTVILDRAQLEEGLGTISGAGAGPGSANTPKDGATPAASSPSGQAGSTIELSVGQAESALLVSTSTKVLEQVLARMAGAGGGALAEVPAFEADARGMLRDGLSYGWIHFAPIAETLARMFPAGEGTPDGDPAAMMAFGLDKMLGAFGLSSLRTLAFNARQNAEGEFFDFYLGVPEETRKGLFAVLNTAPKDASPPAFVPAEAVNFSRWRADGQRIWASVEAIANEIAPGMLGLVVMQVEAMIKEQSPAFDLRKNLIANLGDDFVSYQKTPRGTTLDDLISPPSVTLISSPNPDQLLQGLKSVLSMLAAPLSSASFKEREFLGRKIHSLPMPTLPTEEGGAAAEESVHMTASGGYLAVSTDAALLEEYLRSGETKPKPLAAVPGLSEAGGKVGGMATGLFGYQDDVENLRILTEILRNNGDLISQALAMSPVGPKSGEPDKALKEWFDFSLLPPFEKIAKYFHLTVYAGQISKDGFTLKTFSPRPPKLNP
ncbi:MAG TPA: hypothetical protein P5534_02815 [Candidatus Paceibacterota bacterium]|nr:hypothetical protein [Candidatus Paceibacterota bacterium]HRZ57401.1 hypothetical protein [Candidatus Paceibacterota bacterium]